MEWADLKQLCEDGCPECGKHVFRVRAKATWIVTEHYNQLQFRPDPGHTEYYPDVQCRHCGYLIEPEANDAPPAPDPQPNPVADPR